MELVVHAINEYENEDLRISEIENLVQYSIVKPFLPPQHAMAHLPLLLRHLYEEA